MGRDDSDWLRHEPGAIDFGTAYLLHFDAVYDAVFPLLESHPLLSSMLSARNPEERAASRAHSYARLERALGGDWDFYAASLRQEGAAYARRGFPFGVWQDVSTAQIGVLTRVLIEQLGTQPARLIDAFGALHRFTQRAGSEIGNAYVTESERALRTWEILFQRMPWGICMLDPQTLVIRFANDAFRRMYDLKGADLGVRTLDSLFDADDLVRVRAAHTESAYAAGTVSYEAIHVRSDGARFPVLFDGVLLPASNPDERAWAISVRDLTERQQVESLRAHSLELEMENRRVQEGSRLKSEFLANMSHELRTPLNSILGFSELLIHGEVGPLQDQQRDFIGDIHSSGKHLLRLINDILDLSKVEAGKMEFHAETLDLRALIVEVTGVLRAVASRRSVQFDIDHGTDLGTVQLDPARLKQVLYNYLSNAIKFSPEGGTVTVRTLAQGPTSFRLEVVDHGPGIAADDLGRLFLEFEQLDPGSARSHGGTGLGLALTRRLVEAQGGAVGVQSTVGQGSTFHAVLPRYLPGSSSLPQPRRFAAADSRAPRVLVIEDDAADQECIVHALISAGYAVDTAATGAQALRAVAEHKYDAITLDLLLPDTNGLTMVQSLRKDPNLQGVPVIVISVVSEQVTAGFVVSDALQKPLAPDELLTALRRVGLEPPGAGPVLVVDDDEPSSKLISATLAQMGFRAVVAHDGQKALDRARVEQPVLVVLDLIMPNLDGFGFLKQFRQVPAWSAIPVLIWTVKDLTIAEQKQLRASASAVVPKDNTGSSALAEVVRRHLPTPRVSS